MEFGAAAGGADVYAALGISESDWDVDALHNDIAADLGRVPIIHEDAIAASAPEPSSPPPPGAAAGGAVKRALEKARVADLGTPLVKAIALVMPLLGPDGASLRLRPKNLQDPAEVLFREPRPAPARRYGRGLNRPLDVWKAHGGKSVTRVLLPAEWQEGGKPQELIRRTGKIVRPEGLPPVRYHQYEIGNCGEMSPKTKVSKGARGGHKPSNSVLYHILPERTRKPQATKPAAAGLPGRTASIDSVSSEMSFSNATGDESSTETEEGESWLDVSTDDESSSSSSDSYSQNPLKRMIPTIDLGQMTQLFGGARSSLEGGGDGPGEPGRQRRRLDNAEAEAGPEVHGPSSNMFWEGVSIAAGVAVVSYTGAAHRGRELTDDSGGEFHAYVSQAAHFIDGNIHATYDSEWFRPAEYCLLWMLIVMVLVDAALDIPRRFPQVDRGLTFLLRQFYVRMIFFVRGVVSLPNPLSMRRRHYDHRSNA